MGLSSSCVKLMGAQIKSFKVRNTAVSCECAALSIFLIQSVLFLGGLCKRHGAKVKRWVCKEPGCDKNAHAGGNCWRHTRVKWERRRCQHPGCNKLGLKNGCLCVRHSERGNCTFPGCTNIERRFGVCLKQ